jgi:hypothetical protein
LVYGYLLLLQVTNPDPKSALCQIEFEEEVVDMLRLKLEGGKELKESIKKNSECWNL